MRVGDILTGHIVQVRQDGVLVDIGGKAEDGTTESSDQRPQDRCPFGDDFPPDLVGEEDGNAFRFPLSCPSRLACPSATSDADHTHRFIPPLVPIARYDDGSFGSCGEGSAVPNWGNRSPTVIEGAACRAM